MLLMMCSAHETGSVKASIGVEISVIRGHRPLQLDVNQLSLLARHFKSRVLQCTSVLTLHL